MFQKTRYKFDFEEKKKFVPLEFPVDLKIQTYMEWKGFQDESDIKAAEKKFGKNV